MSFIPRIPEEEGSVAAILGPYPDIAMPICMLTEHVMRTGDCPFTVAERELIAAFVSGVNACTYCAGTHEATAEALGIDHALFSALLDDIDTADVDEKLKPVLKYVKKLTLTPTHMIQGDVDTIFNAGWNENAFHFMIMICGMFNMYNRLLEGYGIKNTHEFRQAAGHGLAESGYMHVAEN